MKKNGFTLVELIVTFTLVSTISFLLFQLIFGLKEMFITTKFKTNLLTRQANLTRRIYTDTLKYRAIKFDNCTRSVENSTLCIDITFADNEDELIQKRLVVYEEQIVYDNYKITVSSTSDGSAIGNIKIKNSYLNSQSEVYNAVLKIDIPITNTLAKGDYGIHITLQYNTVPDELNDSGQVFTDRFRDLIDSETEIVITSTSVMDLMKDIVPEGSTESDGLYEVKYDPDWYYTLSNNEVNRLPQYVYKGENPNNHVIIQEDCYRIMQITNKQVVKLLYEGKAYGDSCEIEEGRQGYIDVTPELSVWGKTNNVWQNTEKQNIRTTLEDWYAEKKMTSNRIGTFTNLLGFVSSSKPDANDTIQGLIADELGIIGMYESVALPTVSDYVMASTNKACQSIKSASQTTECMKNNYMFEADFNYWTLTGVGGTSNQVWSIQNTGKIAPTAITTNTLKIKPVIFLKSTATFTGTGIPADPYKLK